MYLEVALVAFVPQLVFFFLAIVSRIETILWGLLISRFLWLVHCRGRFYVGSGSV